MPKRNSSQHNEYGENAPRTVKISSAVYYMPETLPIQITAWKFPITNYRDTQTGHEDASPKELVARRSRTRVVPGTREYLTMEVTHCTVGYRT